MASIMMLRQRLDLDGRRRVEHSVQAGGPAEQRTALRRASILDAVHEMHGHQGMLLRRRAAVPALHGRGQVKRTAALPQAASPFHIREPATHMASNGRRSCCKSASFTQPPRMCPRPRPGCPSKPATTKILITRGRPPPSPARVACHPHPPTLSPSRTHAAAPLLPPPPPACQTMRHPTHTHSRNLPPGEYHAEGQGVQRPDQRH